MQTQRATRVPQGFVFDFGIKKKKGVTKKGGATKVAPTFGAPAFLTTTIEAIRPTERHAADRLGINLDKSYANVLACCKRFLKFVGITFDFEPKIGLTKSQRLGELIEYFELKIEPLGLMLVVSKKDRQGQETDELNCIVYRYGKELEYSIVIFYCAPARYMSPEGCQMYKRFMKFVTEHTNIPLGIPEYGENFFLDCILNMYDDSNIEDCVDEDRNIAQVIKKYKQDGEFWNLFDEINSLPNETPDHLYKALEKYRRNCPNDELDVVESMMEGIDIIKDANYYWFEFNPDDDGFEEDWNGSEGYSSSVFASAILFSDHDGVSEILIDYVNNELNAGYIMTGWNIHQWLSPKTKKADILEFIRCKDLVASLDKWLIEFYRVTSRFDSYGESE